MTRNTMTAVAACCFLVIAAGVPTPAQADWEYTHWGMTPEQVAAASAGSVEVLSKSDRTRDDADHWEIAAQGHFKSAGRTMSVGFQFDTTTGGLKCVLYNATGDDVKAVESELIRKYGPAKQSSFDGGHSLVWKKPEPIELDAVEKPVAAVVTHCEAGG